MNVPVSVAVRQPSVVKGSVQQGPPKAVGVPQQPAAVKVVYSTPGPQGPIGASGSSAFEYAQNVPASSWTVSHNLNRDLSSISVYDSLGYLVETGVRIIDANNLEITLAAPMSGKVVVS